jgi:hypothetical protein
MIRRLYSRLHWLAYRRRKYERLESLTDRILALREEANDRQLERVVFFLDKAAQEAHHASMEAGENDR